MGSSSSSQRRRQQQQYAQYQQPQYYQAGQPQYYQNPAGAPQYQQLHPQNYQQHLPGYQRGPTYRPPEVYPNHQQHRPNQPPYPQPYPQPQQPPQQQAPPSQSAQPTKQHQTQTVKNQVNLRKRSLQVELTGDNRLILKFDFDALAPCSVTTFFGATELPKQGNKLVAGPQTPGSRVYYPEKSHYNKPHQFPLQESSDMSDHQLNLNLFKRDFLCNTLEDPKNNTYPIIIRLECLAENLDSDDMHTLAESAPGSTLSHWLQAQTTYATLKFDKSSNKWEVILTKQKLWINDQAYLLQDIYGLDGALQSRAEAEAVVEGLTMDDEDLDTGRECVICLTEERDTAVLPCRHFCMCHDCAKELQKSSRQCPICRIKVVSLLQIKMERKKVDENGGRETLSNGQEGQSLGQGIKAQGTTNEGLGQESIPQMPSQEGET